jgi:putative heme transporter
MIGVLVIPLRPHSPATEAPHAPGVARLVMSASFVAAIAVGLYVALPSVAGLDETWGRLLRGDPWWLALAVLLEACSYAGYVLLLRAVFVEPGSRIGWRESYTITMAGVAATRLFAAGGAGGIALTAWATARSGMGRRKLVRRLTTFYVALYSVFVGTLVIVGLGLRAGLIDGPAPVAVTLLPAALGGFVIFGALATALLPRDLDRRLARRRAEGRLAATLRTVARVAAAVAEGVRGALAMLRSGNVALLGAVGWWAFDIAVLWACFHAFGEPPSVAVLVMAYFTGMLANLLPLPGGVGGVEGGMIAAFLAFDVAGGLAVVSVLTYRAFAFWLPTLPGLLAYLDLRRSVREWSRAGS